MKALWLLIPLLYLTSPNGSPLYINADNVVAVRPPVQGECSRCAKTVVVTVGGQFAVKESAAEVAEQLRKAK